MSSPTRRLHKRAALLATAAMLAGCTVGPNFHRPVPSAVSGYAMPGDETNTDGVRAAVGQQVAGDWWALFHSPQLDDLVRQAIAGSPTLAQARARLAEAHDEIAAQTGKLMIDANAGVERQELNLGALSGGSFTSFSIPGFPSFPTNPQFNLYSIGGAVAYNTDLFGGVRRQKESLKANEEAQRRELETAYLTLTGQVVEQALTIADADVQTRDLTEIVKSDQDNVDMARRAYRAGGESRADVAGLESELAQDQAAIPVQQQRRAAARHALAILLGKPPASWSAPDFDEASGTLPAVLPVSLPSELVRQRPDILEAEAQLHAATAQIGVQTANLYPNINLTASLTQTALSPQTLFSPISTGWVLSAGLTAPIFHSGELHARKRQAEDAARVALAQYEITVLNAFGQVADALSAIANDNVAYDAQQRAFNAANARVEMLRKGYAAGGVTALALLDGERDVHRVRLMLAQEGTGRYSDAARLLLATASVPPGAADGPLPPQP
jgi:NodT family efflux transporter outer membrane factor (OMF) lipoprotein